MLTFVLLLIHLRDHVFLDVGGARVILQTYVFGELLIQPVALDHDSRRGKVDARNGVRFVLQLVWRIARQILRIPRVDAGDALLVIKIVGIDLVEHILVPHGDLSDFLSQDTSRFRLARLAEGLQANLHSPPAEEHGVSADRLTQ
jgi:hypothetical protein